MRVPHTIPVSTLRVYAASDQTCGLQAERYRTIRSEDLSWDDCVPLNLTYLCIQVLAANFIQHYQVLPFLSQQDYDYLLEVLSEELPLEVVCPIINDGIYWQRRCMARWHKQPLDISKHRQSWKQLYIERHCQEYIHSQEPGYIDWNELKKLMEICSPFINRLEIKELKPPRKWGPKPNLPDLCTRGKIDPDHMDLSPILENLHNLTELSIRYSVLNCGMKYDPECFKISTTDVINLGIGLKRVRYLNSFHLHRCALDDVKVNYIIEALVYCTTLDSLEISHCKFGDIGAKSLGKLLTMHRALTVLSIQNNKIKSKGARGLAFALTHETCCPIRYLDLEFNNIGNDGVISIASALTKNRTIKELYLGSVGMTSIGAKKIAEALLFSTITKISLTNNHLNTDVSESLVAAVQNNRRIETLDIRRCGIGETAEIAIQKYAARNRINYRLI